MTRSRGGIVLITLAVPLAAQLVAGCGEATGTFDDGLAEAYTEVVLAEAMHPGDSAAWRNALAGKLDGTGYDSPESVYAAVQELAARDSRGFTSLMDSVQMRLERIRSGTSE